MRKRYAAFVIMLGAVLLMKLGVPVLAEMLTDAAVKESYREDSTYMLGEEDAVGCVLTKEAAEAVGETPEDEAIVQTSENTHIYEKDSARAEIKMTLKKTDATDEDWNEIAQWIDFAIASAGIDAEEADAKELAQSLLSAVISAQRRATYENGQVPAFDKSLLSIDLVSVEKPYYALLQRGDRSDEVKKLQERLITLGYLEGEADGQFGKITAQAIMNAQKELLEKETALYAPEPTPTPEPSPEAASEAEATPEAVATPAPEIPEYQPETKVDGVADQIFQIRLYSDIFPITVPDLSAASSGLIERFQKKLIELGYMTGKADGQYGPNTRRGVRLYQHYNGLSETGGADENTQKSVYSESAKAAANPILTSGSSGEGVKKLQNFLIRYGFMRSGADGDYGAATVRAVESLQTYMREKETRATTPVAADPASVEGGYTVPAANVVPATEVTGVADPLLLDEIYAASPDEWIPRTLKNGDESSDVTRIQTRLQALEYIFYTPDGTYADGTENAVRAFQARNGLGQDGIAGKETMEKLFSTEAVKALKPYVLKVSVDKQRVYAYAPDKNEEYTILKKTMTCSTGLSSSPTPKGTFQSSTGPGARWHYFKKFYCWAQYAYYIEGDIMFHSVLYGSKGGSVTSSSVRNLGSRASHGCVRLSVEDAKWIYENCPKNTKVVVY